MVYLSDYYEDGSELELTMRAKQVLNCLELPTPSEYRVINKASTYAYFEKTDAIHSRHIRQAWQDLQREELDNLPENMENHSEFSVSQF